jgi:hypothetical protein
VILEVQLLVELEELELPVDTSLTKNEKQLGIKTRKVGSGKKIPAQIILTLCLHQITKFAYRLYELLGGGNA